MIVISTEVRVVDETGSRLILSCSDVAPDSTQIPATIALVAAQVTFAAREATS